MPRLFWRLLRLGLLLSPVIALVLVFESEPVLGPVGAPTAEDVARTKALYREARALTESGAPGTLALTQGDLNAALAMGARVLPEFRGRGRIGRAGITVTVALRIPRAAWAGWINLRATAPPSEDGLRFSRVTIGPYPLPAGLIVPAGRRLANLVLGDGVGDIAAGAVTRLAVRGQRAEIGIALGAKGRRRLAGQVKGELRAALFRSRPDEVRAYLARFAADGPAPDFAAYLRRALAEAARRARAGGEATRTLEAMLFAVGTACGTRRLEEVIGPVLPGAFPDPPPCTALRLAGRDDLRRHFAVSAALHAASEAGTAFAIGEMKELMDIGGGGSGFSFDDLMADRAGIRFAEGLYAGGPSDWIALADRLTGDAALLPDPQDLPSGLSRMAFRSVYGSLDSPAYKRMVAAIDARIARETAFGGR